MKKKVPVVTKDGTDYIVKFTEIRSADGWGWGCELFKPIKFKGIKLFNFYLYAINFHSSWESDFIQMADNIIKTYENMDAERDTHKQNTKKNIEKLKQWNGRL